MPIQTVEEALIPYANKRGVILLDGKDYSKRYKEGFEDGAAWMKEQCIPHMTVDELAPAIESIITSFLYKLQSPKSTHNELMYGYISNGSYDCTGVDIEDLSKSIAEGIEKREQGIQWISVKDGVLPEVNESVLILLEGETFLRGKLMYNSHNELIWVVFFADGEKPVQIREVTHYAYVNLPKTISNDKV